MTIFTEQQTFYPLEAGTVTRNGTGTHKETPMEHGGFVIRRNFARINFPAIWPRLGSKRLLLGNCVFVP